MTRKPMPLQHKVFVHDGEMFDHHFLCCYRPYSSGADLLSRSLLRFKSKDDIDVQAWSTCAGQELQKSLVGRQTIVVRALASRESHASIDVMSPLDQVCRSIVEGSSADYLPLVLRKHTLNRPLKFLGAEARRQALLGSYKFSLPERFFDHILVVDDIFTSGATLASIITAIRQVTSCSVSLFTLATTDRKSEANLYASFKANSYEWEPQKGWRHVQEGSPYYHSKHNLMTLILRDFSDA